MNVNKDIGSYFYFAGIVVLLAILNRSHAFIFPHDHACAHMKGRSCIRSKSADYAMSPQNFKTETFLGNFLKRKLRKEKIPALNGDVCGQPAVSTDKRIVGGSHAVPHSWPWQVSVQVDGSHVCGGSIVDKRWILTAAHCEQFMFFGDITVLVGEHDFAADEPSTKRHTVHWTIPHPHFVHRTYNNDVMLLKLHDPIEFTDKVSPICLPHHKEVFQPGHACIVSGWGRLESHGQLPELLHEVEVPIISHEICNGMGWYNGLVSTSMICAGLELGGQDACQYDSGGPLACHQDGAWKLAGVVSWGVGCGQERKPGVYAKVSKYIPWIKEVIEQN